MKIAVPNLPLPAFFHPNQRVPKVTEFVLSIMWIGIFLVVWELFHFTKPLIPSLEEIAGAMVEQAQAGSIFYMVLSLMLSFQAIFLAIVVGLGLSYLSTVPFFKAPVVMLGSFRTLSLAGISFLFLLFTKTMYEMKIVTLAFAIIVFLVNSMLQVIDDIPQGDFDYARTLGWSELKVLREVVIRGTLANAFDVIRMTAAMAWMMLAFVETMSRDNGGIGILLNDLGRASNYAAVFAVQLMILAAGMLQDGFIRFCKSAVCPYTSIA